MDTSDATPEQIIGDSDEALKRSLLVGLSSDGLENVLSAFHPHSYQAGSTIVRAGDDGDELFLIMAGMARVSTSEDGHNDESSSEHTLSLLGPGDHFGEASIISGVKRTASVTALTYVDAMVLHGDDYRRLVKDYPQLLENLSRSLTKRLSKMNARPTSSGKPKRSIHSLAVLVDHPAGWNLVKLLLAEIRSRGKSVQPIFVSAEESLDGETRTEINRLDDPAILQVAHGDLGYTIAERSQHALAVVIASGTRAQQLAARECNRVVVATSASETLTPELSQCIQSLPERRRPIMALLFDGDAARPSMTSDLGQVVRCRYALTGDQAHIDAACGTRLYRALIGKRIGLALGGGGARGIAHIGVMEAMVNSGIVFDSIAGTSAGAIVAAACGAGFAPEKVGDFFRKEMVPPAWMAKRSSTRRMFLLHSFRGGRFETKLRRYLFKMTFDQADLPLAITTLDLISGEQKIRRKGDLVKSVLQSINHPVFGRPIIQDGQMLVDGGVLMNVPASVLRNEGCDHVISIDVGSTIATDYGKDRRGNLKVPSYLSTLLRTMDISRRHSSALHRDESDLIIIPQTSQFRIEDFHAVDPLIESGREAGNRCVEEVKQLIARIQPPFESP
ncbi:MAG: cyclic nucleotide-binding and patatin-like phospholipase domain-containing protein [Planctomycetota bacterium]